MRRKLGIKSSNEKKVSIKPTNEKKDTIKPTNERTGCNLECTEHIDERRRQQLKATLPSRTNLTATGEGGGEGEGEGGKGGCCGQFYGQSGRKL